MSLALAYGFEIRACYTSGFLVLFFAFVCDLSPSGATWIIQILPAHISYNAVRLREAYAAKHAQQPRTEFSTGASGLELYPDPGQGLTSCCQSRGTVSLNLRQRVLLQGCLLKPTAFFH